jgi:hypothetical protein
LVAVFVASKMEKMNLARGSISPIFSAVPMQSSFAQLICNAFSGKTLGKNVPK